MYFAETSQRINAALAQHIVDDIRPFVDGKPNIDGMNKLFHDVMVVNPSVEVYLLDANGATSRSMPRRTHLRVASANQRVPYFLREEARPR